MITEMVIEMLMFEHKYPGDFNRILLPLLL
jgi:hypothetical protein